MKLEYVFKIGRRYSFICQGTSTKRQRSNLFDLESNCPLLLPVYPLIGRGNPVKCLAERYDKRTCRRMFTLSVCYAERQAGSCEYQLLKSFGLTRPGNRIKVYQLLTQK